MLSAEAIFLVILGTSSFPAKNEVRSKIIGNFVPNCERVRTQHD